MARKEKIKKFKLAPAAKGSRAVRFVLFLGDEGAILVHIQGDKVLKRLFASNAEPITVRAFVELLQSAPQVPLYLMVDMMDQSYVRHDLPPVSSMSVAKLIKRRLDRDFAPEDIKGSIRLGRDTQGRKDWNYLLLSLAMTNQLSQWLNLIYDAPNPFKGIYLVPIEAQQFIAQLSRIVKAEKDRDPSAWQILVSHNKVGGFRQVVLKDGKLVFTRLAQPVGETMAEVIAGNIEQEVLNTIEYIKRLSYNEQAGLDLFVIVSQEIKNAIDPNKFKAANLEIYTPYEGATKLKIDQAALPGDHFGDVLLAASFGASRKHILKLNTPYARKLDMLNAAQGGIKLVTGIAACGLVLYAGSLAYEIYDASSQSEKSRNEQKIAESNFARLQEQAKALPVDVELLTQTVSAYGAMSKDDRTPFDLVARLGGMLGNGVRLKSFRWSVEGASGAAPGRRSNALPAADAGAPIPTGPTVAELEVEFTRGTDTPEEFVRVSNRFFALLRERLKDYSVTASKLPGTVGEAETLQLTFDGGNTPGDNQAFAPGKPVVVVVVIAGPTEQKNASPAVAPLSPVMPPSLPGGGA